MESSSESNLNKKKGIDSESKLLQFMVWLMKVEIELAISLLGAKGNNHV